MRVWRQRIAQELRKNCAELRAAHRPPARHQALVRVQPHIVRRHADHVGAVLHRAVGPDDKVRPRPAPILRMAHHRLVGDHVHQRHRQIAVARVGQRQAHRSLGKLQHRRGIERVVVRRGDRADAFVRQIAHVNVAVDEHVGITRPLRSIGQRLSIDNKMINRTNRHSQPRRRRGAATGGTRALPRISPRGRRVGAERRSCRGT